MSRPVAEAPTARPVPAGDKSPSQTLKTLLLLRDLIVKGALKPGERVSELQMVDRLGVSRTPVRAALVRLEQEGLVEAIASGGYAVKAFSEREVMVAIEIRGTLEGLAARFAAERGVPAAEIRRAREVLDEIDGVVRRETVDVDIQRYVELNARFHAGVIAMAQSRTLAREIELAGALPFASPSALVPVQTRSPESHHILTVAQDQHRTVLAAIERREGTRAEAIMREHARIAHRNLERALTSEGALDLVPGAALIRRGAER
ncbi:GntR family transcriptional regulator [Prosthecomicrobium sp. N25]|uniref:GntR family transcriptional regulator n=1 Tax=Prosthecomicrobium sp. N25 TaxID=3129254 RepID=UPI0030774B5B